MTDAGPTADQYCLFHRRVLPDRFPVQPRPDMAVFGPIVVALRRGQRLLCNCEHAGPHLWPSGDEAEPDEPTSTT